MPRKNRDWEQWIDRHKSANLTAEELREFEAALNADPANLDAYMDALLTEAALESENLPALSLRDREPLPLRGRVRRALALAAGAAVIASAAYFAGRKTVHVSSPAPAELAMISNADAAAEKVGIRIGQSLTQGSLFVPDNSNVAIAMRSGARVEISGPARLTLESSGKIRLHKGRMKSYAPTYAHGFTVDTDDGKIVDLGTNFVTTAGTKAGTEVHVLEGLVEAYASGGIPGPYDLAAKHAVILKDGQLKSTEYLEQRLNVPLNPVLPDSDGDGIPDVVEEFYGTDPHSAASKPELLRFGESFDSFPAGPFIGTPSPSGAPVVGKHAHWEGKGTILKEGLSYQSNGRSLRSSGGAVRTVGDNSTGTLLVLGSGDLAPQGVVYISFLAQMPKSVARTNFFGGLLLYKSEREELFVGKITTSKSFGSRLKFSEHEESFPIAPDDKTHLFVIRCDRTRLVTDLFIDPPLDQPEAAIHYQTRYYDVPEFDRISLRSGGPGGFPTVFDEIRVGLTWDAVVPVDH